MENISKFFTGRIGHFKFITFGTVHLSILFIALIISIFVYNIKNENRNLELFIGCVLVFQQITLYSWYFISKFNNIKEGLPLYHCRIAIIFLGLGLVFNKKNLIKFGSYLGIFGSIVALLFPAMDPFAFPHITQFSFFIGHLFLLWGCVYSLAIKKVGMSKLDLNYSLIFINIYHVLMFILNNKIYSNYGYMSHPPFSMNFQLPHLFYGFLIMMLFNIVFISEYICLNKVGSYDKNDNEYELVS